MGKGGRQTTLKSYEQQPILWCTRRPEPVKGKGKGKYEGVKDQSYFRRRRAQDDKEMRLKKVKVQTIRGAESRVNRDRNIERSGGEGGRK